ncbi:hypothetical protein [Rhodanobacter sp. FW106-PBR-LB-1-21]|uniref:hypothetical protein n=1 Tax=Rhodanobacter sp. FW106-PBR-LB-1-21 TaxID=3454842 RepID=UPI003F6EF676
MRDILAEAASANTARSYASALRYCAAWYQGRYGQPFALPLPEAVVIQFIVDHLARRSESRFGRDSGNFRKKNHKPLSLQSKFDVFGHRALVPIQVQ